jgi:K+ transporter
MADVIHKGTDTRPLVGSSTHASHFALAVASIGVVYGDIGTSPLYAFRVAVVAAAGNGPITHDAVLGVLSLILWALAIVVTLKYVLILLRADNNGEGGTLALTALATRVFGRGTALLFMLGRQSEVPLDTLVANLEKGHPHVVPGTAVFLTSDPSSAPTSLLHNLKHNALFRQG